MNVLLGFGALTCALWLPGMLVAKRCGIRAPNFAGFLLSPLFVYVGIFLAELIGVSLSRWVALGGLFGMTAAIWYACRSKENRVGLFGGLVSPSCEKLQAYALPAIVFGSALLIVAVRAIRRPLTGWDTTYRWTWLAEKMVQKGTFGFYPPVSDADFMTYLYCDGIPPITQFMHFICFVGFGGTNPVYTAPLVIMQYVLIAWVTALLACRLSGGNAERENADCSVRDAGAGLAVALAATSPLLLWAIVMGQETGWTALGIAGMVYYLHDLKSGDWPCALAAGAAAALSALAREYGCAFVILAVAWALVRKWDRRQLGALIGCGLIAFSWYLRNWIRTGNPVFSNNIAGIFPGNAVHDAIMAGYVQYLSPMKHGWVWSESAQYLFRGAFVPLAIGIAGLVALRKRQVGLLVFCVGLVGALWLYSVGKTAGGPRYALRVLAPAIVLLAAVGGAWLAQAPKKWIIPGMLIAWLAVLPGLISTPFYGSYANLKQCFAAADAPSNWYSSEASRIVGVASQRPGRILTDVPNACRWFAGTGVDLVPVYSPGVQFLFDANSEAPAAQRQRLKSTGIRYVLKSNGGLNDAYLMKDVPLFSADSANWELIYEDPMHVLYKLP